MHEDECGVILTKSGYPLVWELEPPDLFAAMVTAWRHRNADSAIIQGRAALAWGRAYRKRWKEKHHA